MISVVNALKCYIELVQQIFSKICAKVSENCSQTCIANIAVVKCTFCLIKCISYVNSHYVCYLLMSTKFIGLGSNYLMGSQE